MKMGWLDRVRTVWCHHEDVLRLDGSRMWLECLACGRETRGMEGLGRPVRVDEIAARKAHAEWLASRVAIQ